MMVKGERERGGIFEARIEGERRIKQDNRERKDGHRREREDG